MNKQADLSFFFFFFFFFSGHTSLIVGFVVCAGLNVIKIYHLLTYELQIMLDVGTSLSSTVTYYMTWLTKCNNLKYCRYLMHMITTDVGKYLTGGRKALLFRYCANFWSFETIGSYTYILCENRLPHKGAGVGHNGCCIFFLYSFILINRLSPNLHFLVSVYYVYTKYLYLFFFLVVVVYFGII